MQKLTALTPLKKWAWKVILAPFLKMIECVCELIVPFLVKAIIDDGLTQGGAHYHELDYIFGLCGAVLGLAVFGFCCTMVTQYVASRVSTDFSYESKKMLFGHLNTISMVQLERYGKNKALNLINNDSSSLQRGVQMFMRLLCRAPFLVIGSVIAAFVVNVYAGLAVLASLLLCSLVIFVVFRITPSRYTELHADLDNISSLGEDGIVGSRVVRAFNKQEEEIASFQEASLRYAKTSFAIARINAFLNPLTFALVNLAIVAILSFGSYLQPQTGLSVGSIVALISFLTQSLTALMQFTTLVTSLSQAWASKKRIDAFLAIEPDIVDGELQEEKELQLGDLIYDFHDVSLSFGGEANVLSHLNFQLRKGEKVGIIGGTGSGKSTLLSLLGRFIDASEGVIDYKGHPIKESKLSAIRGDLALVSQKPQLFKGTILENITLGQSFTEEEIQAAVKGSLVSEFIGNYDDGLNHVVEEGGTNFSGGQKQRLLLCRALLSKRPILLLDDATSALDYKSDLTVRRNIEAIPGVTTVFVSQRATSIKDCQRIYVLDKGEVVGVGTHEELLSSCDVYREIYEAQVNQK